MVVTHFLPSRNKGKIYPRLTQRAGALVHFEPAASCVRVMDALSGWRRSGDVRGAFLRVVPPMASLQQ